MRGVMFQFQRFQGASNLNHAVRRITLTKSAAYADDIPGDGFRYPLTCPEAGFQATHPLDMLGDEDEEDGEEAEWVGYSSDDTDEDEEEDDEETDEDDSDDGFIVDESGEERDEGGDGDPLMEDEAGEESEGGEEEESEEKAESAEEPEGDDQGDGNGAGHPVRERRKLVYTGFVYHFENTNTRQAFRLELIVESKPRSEERILFRAEVTIID